MLKEGRKQDIFLSKIITSTFSRFNLGFLDDITELYIVNKFKRKAGDAYYHNGKSEIRISKKFYDNTNIMDPILKELIVHETCHIINMYFRSKSSGWRRFDSLNDKTKGHGQGWKMFMDLCGYKNASPLLDTLNGVDIFTHICPRCSHVDILTVYLAGRIKNGSSKKGCSKCFCKMLGHNMERKTLTNN